MKGLKGLLIYSLSVLVVSIAYYFYLQTAFENRPEHETWLSEIGEGFGEVALWGLLFIYARTLLKLLMGKGAIAKRVLPDFTSPVTGSGVQKLLRYLDRSHVHFGIATVAVIILHIALVGLPWEILFFPAVLALVLWQALFGLFLRWRYSPRELRKFAYLVHAQLVTGIAIGIFALLGHQLIDN